MKICVSFPQEINANILQIENFLIVYMVGSLDSFNLIETHFMKIYSENCCRAQIYTCNSPYIIGYNFIPHNVHV